jgi:hypothetical protein
MNDNWEERFKNIRQFGKLGLGGLILASVSVVVPDDFRPFFAVFGFFLILPAFAYLYVMVILHWKARYRGKRSDLWGVLILVEAAGCLKVVYLFRHIVPDLCGRGRYRHSPVDPMAPARKASGPGE